MSAAPDTADAAPKKGKKKLIIIIAAVLVLVAGGGGGALVVMKKQHAAAEAEAEEGGDHADGRAAKAKKKAAAKGDAAALPPVFLPLEPFTVNLADRDAERYAQIGITLELDETPTAERIKAYLPAIRNNILLVISHKTAVELLDLEGKHKLAREIQRQTLLPLGVEMEPEEEEEPEEATEGKKPRKKKRQAEPEDYPVVAVHFSNFIIQ